jgi:hypothetical protein
LVLEEDEIVAVADEVTRRPVARTGEDPSVLGVVGVDDDELVVHARAAAVATLKHGNGWVEVVQCVIGILALRNLSDANAGVVGRVGRIDELVVVRVVDGDVGLGRG